jgi:GH18 family chitinase
LREKKPSIKIVPRFACSEFTGPSYKEWLKGENMDHFIKILMRFVKSKKLDGLVLECNHLWMIEDLYSQYSMLIEKISKELRKEKEKVGKDLTFIVVAYPYADSFANILNKTRFQYISQHVDFFSIMSYDYVSYVTKHSEKFNAPLSWINKTIENYVDLSKPNKDELLGKILLGLPFHGVLIEKGVSEPKASHLDGQTFSSLIALDEGTQLVWNSNESEHQVHVNKGDKNYVASYPTKRVFNF